MSNRDTQSGILRRMETEGSRILGVPPLYIHPQTNGSIAITDQGGFVVTADEWRALSRGVAKFHESPGIESWIAENNAARHERETPPPAPDLPARNVIVNRDEHVYVLAAERNRVKIGRTRNVKRRVCTLTIGSPVELTLVVSVKSKDAYQAERHLHQRYAEYRVRGEWFDLPQETIDWLSLLSDYGLDEEFARGITEQRPISPENTNYRHCVD